MSFFKFANKEETTRYYVSEENKEDYVEFRAQLTKREANQLLKHAPTEEKNLDQGLTFLEQFFGLTAVGWSFIDNDKNPVAPTVENYRNLEAGVARWIDDQIGKHMQVVLGRHVEALEGESSS